MKELGLLRHAKSDWKCAVREDHDRPLATRGVEAARFLGRFVAATTMVPEALFSSTAERARSTAERALEAGVWKCPIAFAAELYAADRRGILEFVRRLDDGYNRVILVGHNPGWEEFLSSLVGGGRFKLPTASLAWVKIAAEHWNDCGPGSGTLAWLVTPKLLRRAGFKG